MCPDASRDKITNRRAGPHVGPATPAAHRPRGAVTLPRSAGPCQGRCRPLTGRLPAVPGDLERSEGTTDAAGGVGHLSAVLYCGHPHTDRRPRITRDPTSLIPPRPASSELRLAKAQDSSASRFAHGPAGRKSGLPCLVVPDILPPSSGVVTGSP